MKKETKDHKTIVITGTHHTPAVELIDQLHSDSTDWQIYYIGRNYNSSVTRQPSIEKKEIPKLNVSFFGINCGKLDRRFLPNTIRGLPSTIMAVISAYRILSRTKPDIVVSFGGYVSVPVIIAAWLKNIPSITHEQTLTNSLSTRLNALFATKVALSFKNTSQISNLPRGKAIVTGNLLRRAIFKTTSNSLKSRIKSSKPILFITAGNQGSQTLNKIIFKLLPKLTEKYFVIHQTGPLDKNHSRRLQNKFPQAYLALPFIGIDDIGWVLNSAALVISRAGANTTQELFALNKKAILIPLPYSQQNEQTLNAQWLSHNHPATTEIIDQSQLNQDLLLQKITSLMTKKLPKPLPAPENFSNSKLVQLIHGLL